jgi:hypothetical protein
VDKAEDDIVDSGQPPVDEASAPVEESVPLDEVMEPEVPADLSEAEAPEEIKEIKKPVDLFADEKKTDMTPFLVIAGVFGLAVVFLILAWANFWNYSTALYFAGLTFLPLLLWLGRKTNTVYVVLLACVIAVLMTSIFCLWTVLAKYHFDIKAAEAKERVGMVQPVDRGLQIAIRAEGAGTFADC